MTKVNMTRIPEPFHEQRAHKRYTLSGSATMQTAGRRIAGKVVNLSSGGLLVKSNMIAPVGTEISMNFSLSVAAGGFEASVRGIVVWIRLGMVGIQFLEGPPGLAELLMGLEKQFLEGPPRLAELLMGYEKE
jgi:hypothetical protein